jgi:hypothetical protein
VTSRRVNLGTWDTVPIIYVSPLVAVNRTHNDPCPEQHIPFKQVVLGCCGSHFWTFWILLVFELAPFSVMGALNSFTSILSSTSLGFTAKVVTSTLDPSPESVPLLGSGFISVIHWFTGNEDEQEHVMIRGIISRQMPKDSNPQSDEKSDASEALTLLTTPRQRGHLAPYQRFPLILHLTSTASAPMNASQLPPPSPVLSLAG